MEVEEFDNILFDPWYYGIRQLEADVQNKLLEATFLLWNSGLRIKPLQTKGDKLGVTYAHVTHIKNSSAVENHKE